MREFFSNYIMSAARFSGIENYLTNNVLRGSQFICRHFESCKASHNGDFGEGQLHHIGRNYDLTDSDGRPLRVVVVGQEYGRVDDLNRLVGLDARHEQIAVSSGLKSRFKSDGLHAVRNPHMRGTTSVLRLVFGVELGSDHDDEYITVNGNRTHLFSAFALINFLLCSATHGDTKTKGRSTPTMRGNCSNHFRSVMRLLEPTIIVIQGDGTSKWVKQVFAMHRIDSVLPISRIRDGYLDALVLEFTHPSAPRPNLAWGWIDPEKMPYLTNTIRPAVMKALALVGQRDG